MRDFDDDDDFDDELDADNTPTTRRRSARRTSADYVKGARSARTQSSGGNSTIAKAALIAGCILAVGIGGMILVRMKNLEAIDGAPSEEVAASQSDSPSEAATDIGAAEDPPLEVPAIQMPDDMSAAPSADSRPRRRRSDGGVSVQSPDDEDISDDASIRNTAEASKAAVPNSDRATPDYGLENPYSSVNLITAVNNGRGQRLLAGVKNIRIHVVRLKEDSRGVVTEAITNGVRTGLERCRLTWENGHGEPAMLVELSVVGNKVLMVAALICRDSADYLTVWQKSAQVGFVNDRALKEGILTGNLTREADSFFADLRGILVELRRQYGTGSD